VKENRVVSFGRIFIVLAALLVFSGLLLTAEGTAKAEDAGGGNDSGKDKETLSRTQISREHHVLMQEIIDSLREMSGVVRKVVDGNLSPQERDDMRTKVDTLGKKLDELSKKHEMLMKAVDDIFREAANKKKQSEDKPPNGKP
jgi:vacuolar-type H+-ATPase subunit I/STV1